MRLLKIWFSSTAVIPSMLFRNVGALESARVVLSGFDIGPALDDYDEHESR